MSAPFVAEIRIFGFNFAPTGWAVCNGQLLPISQNTALFSLLGTFYGGDGKSTFALPNFQDNAPMQQGQGPGLSLRDLGDMSGTSNVTLLSTEMPAHTHTLQAVTDPGTTDTPNGAMFSSGNWNDGQGGSGGMQYYSTTAPNTGMNPLALSLVGSNFPHNNMQPYMALNFCIALQGVFPPRG